MSTRSGNGATNSTEVIDLKYYWSVLMGHKWNIFGLVAVVSMLTLLVAYSMERVYSASTTVMVEAEKAKIVSIEDVYGGSTAGKEYFLTQFEILKSRELAERVVKRLDLVNHPVFDPRQQEKRFSIRDSIRDFLGFEKEQTAELTARELQKNAVRKLQGGLTIAPVRNTQLVKINYESTDPVLAAKITDAIAEQFIESHLESKLSVTEQAAGWLTARLDGLRATLQDSEQRLQQYREQSGLVDVKGIHTLDADELTELTQRYVEASNTRSQAETVYRQAQQFGSTQPIEKLLTIPAVLADPLVQSMKEEHARAERKVAELGNRYGPKHPKMIAARSDVEQTQANLNFQVGRVANGIETRYRGAVQTERSLKAQIDNAKHRFQDVNRKEFRLRELEREVATNQQIYDMFLTRAKETNQTEGLQTAHARIVDPAVIPQDPIKPQKKLILALTVVVSGMVGVILALLLDSLNNTLRSPDEIEEKLGLPMLGFLPLIMKNRSKLPLEGFTPKSKGIFAEAIRSVRTAFVLSGIDKPQKVTVITSSIPGEGKSTVALNFARALSQVEKVLLIDADMRRPTLSRVLDLPKGSPGLSNWVAGTATADEVIYKMDDWDVDVVPSGVIPTNPLELISSKRFQVALKKLADHYDRIVIDSAPVCAVSDALMLSKEADALIYVVKADSSKTDLVLKGIHRLQEVDAPILGVVLNQIDIKKSSRFSDYYPGYFQNYGYSSEEEFYAQQKYQKPKGDELPYEQRRVSGIDDI